MSCAHRWLQPKINLLPREQKTLWCQPFQIMGSRVQGAVVMLWLIGYLISTLLHFTIVTRSVKLWEHWSQIIQDFSSGVSAWWHQWHVELLPCCCFPPAPVTLLLLRLSFSGNDVTVTFDLFHMKCLHCLCPVGHLCKLLTSFHMNCWNSKTVQSNMNGATTYWCQTAHNLYCISTQAAVHPICLTLLYL